MIILVIDDSMPFLHMTCDQLRRAGWQVDGCHDAEDGRWHALQGHYDAVILDVVMPGIGGLDILRAMRAAGIDSPVLLLTAQDAVEDRVQGLDAGADDYLVKPFAFPELEARLRALTRRRYAVSSGTLQVGPLSIDTAARTVAIDGVPIDLPRREYGMLEMLALRQGEVISRSEIEEHLYDENAELASNVVDTAIYNLRKHLNTAGASDLIATKRGQGYLLRCPVEA